MRKLLKTKFRFCTKHIFMCMCVCPCVYVCPCVKVNECLWCNGYHRLEMVPATRVQNLDETVSHNANTLEKGRNPIILLAAMDK